MVINQNKIHWYEYLLPVLWGSYPILTLLVSNLGQVQPDIILRPGLASILTVYLMFGLGYAITRDLRRANLFTFVFTIGFFSYGHIYDLLEGVKVGSLVLGRHRFLTPVWAIFLAAVLWWVWKRKSVSLTAMNVIMIMSAALVVIPVFQIGSFLVKEATFKNNSTTQAAVAGTSSGEKPDVYYIILDMYGRSDQIKEEVGYDNSDFIHYLESKGFYVAKCAQSNFNHTQFSLAVSLNMRYFGTDENVDVDHMGTFIKNSVVRKQFEAMGYKTVAFQTGFNFTEWQDADYYFKPSTSSSTGGGLSWMNSFEVMYLRTTLLSSVVEANINNVRTNEGNEKRLLTLFIFNKLKEIPDISGPKFVFVHLNSTHPPFVFGPNGEPVDTFSELWDARVNEKAFLQGYRDSIPFTDSQMEKVVDAILSKSKTPPIIIIQGDHGLQMAEGGRRLDILNAYYLPAGGEKQLYPDISPVNSFRIVFNQYFGGTYPLLKDESYSARVGASPLMLENTCKVKE